MRLATHDIEDCDSCPYAQEQPRAVYCVHSNGPEHNLIETLYEIPTDCPLRKGPTVIQLKDE